MTKHKYIEMVEEEYDEQTEIPNIVRLAVTTDEEADAIYNQYKDSFKKIKAHVVEGEHFADSKLNKPCKQRKYVDGVLEQSE